MANSVPKGGKITSFFTSAKNFYQTRRLGQLWRASFFARTVAAGGRDEETFSNTPEAN
jgi:hypothetical protein